MSQINLSGITALQNVAAGTTIYIRYYASGQTTTGGWGFLSSSSGVNGLAIGGTVTAASGSPSLSTPTAASITNNSATLGATITGDGGSSITARGTVYKTSSPVADTDNALAEGGTATGAFSHVRTSLSPQTQYFYAGYATNSSGTGLSAEGNFRTLSNPPTAQATGLSGTATSQTAIDLSWSSATFPGSGATTTGYLLLRATSPNTPSLSNSNGAAPAAGANTTIVSSTILGSATTASAAGLSASTTYNFLLVPFCWDGTNAATYNYLTASAPTASATTFSPPSITVNPTSIAFGQVVSGTNSGEQSYTASGSNLTANISITAPVGVEISLTSGSYTGTTGNTLTLTQSGGTVSSTTIYARYTASATGAISGNIAHSSTGATTQNVAIGGTVLATEPTQQGAPVVNSVTSSTIVLSGYSTGNGTSVLMAAKQGSAVDAFPVDGTSYTKNNTFGSGSNLGSNNYVVVINDAEPVTISGLSPATTYHFACFEYNGSGTTANYLTTNPGVVSATTLASTPTASPTAPTFSSVTANSMTVGWTAAAGSPAGYIVLYNSGATAPNTNPTNGTAYTVGATIGNATVAYVGSDVSFPLTGLTDNTRYNFTIYSYNGGGVTTAYRTTSPLTSNQTTPNIAAPVATAATDLAETSFTANWNAVSGATGYRLDVSSSTDFGASASVSEGFSGGATAPSGWTFTGITGTYTTSSNFGASSPSIRFDDTNDRVTTPSFSGASTQLSFWLKGQATNATSALLVEGFDGTDWVTIQNINNLPTTGTTYTYNSGSTPALANNFTQYRFTYTKSSGNLAFDDVAYEAFSAGGILTGYNNLSVSGTSQSVTGLTDNTTYHYRARAVGPNSTSSNSNVISATTTAGCTPSAWYADSDGDTYGNAAVSQMACSQPGGYVASNTDCNDAVAGINPGATEIAGDNIDQNCDGAELCFTDGDDDGYRPDASSTTSGNSDADCNDPFEALASDPTTDCNDANAAVNPGATEVCNSIDDDCDGSTDEGVQTTFYQDSDGDTYGNAAVSQMACTQPGGYVSNSTDCNDAVAGINPGATEIAGDNIDQNCDGVEPCYTDADDDGYRPDASSTTSGNSDADCNDPFEALASDPTTDCNDANATIKPGATEVCNGIDDDCDGSTDEGVQTVFYQDSDGDTYGNAAVSQSACTQPGGYVSNSTDCNDAVAAINPGATEIAGDEIDQNCDGAETCFADADDDGYRPGTGTATVNSTDTDCNDANEALASDPTGDCNDSNAAIKPGATELCNGVDDNCDGTTEPYAPNTGNSGIYESYAVVAGTFYDLQNATGNPDFQAFNLGQFGPGGTLTLSGGQIKTFKNGAANICGGKIWYSIYPASGSPTVWNSVALGFQNDLGGGNQQWGTTGNMTNILDGLGLGNYKIAVYVSASGGASGGCGTDPLHVQNNGCANWVADFIICTTTTYYQDADGDSYGNASVSQTVCGQPAGYVTDNTDCNDGNDAIRPNATEITGDNIDQNCDGQESCFTDADNDGYYLAGLVTSTDTDCNDTGEGALSETAGDCNDNSAAINAGATEQAGDEIDQNCDGAELCFADGDNDGYRTTSTVASTDIDCDDAGEAEATDPAGDCNDGNDAIRPNATEIAGDNMDQNCDGQESCFTDLDNDGYYLAGLVTSTDTDCNDTGEGALSETAGDCNDNSAAINAGATEQAGDEIDQNCDGAELCFADGDNDGYRTTSTVASTDTDCDDLGEAETSDPAGDCNDANNAINPGATEVCNGIDDDCDLSTDEGVQTTFYQDSDGDTYGNAAVSQMACTQPGGYVANSTDCDDAASAINPGATELAGDNTDQNCDGQEICYTDADNDGYRPGTGTSTVNSTDADCNDANEAVSGDPTGDCDDANGAIRPNATEIAGDNIDQNCDGAELCFADADDDGYRPGTGTATVNSTDTDCNDANEAISSDPTGDCNDANAAIKPGATELVNDGIDQNCDNIELCYADADNDGYRPDASTTVNSSDLDCDDSGEAVAADPTGDCNDANANIRPNQADYCNGTNDDCDGSTDEDGGGPNNSNSGIYESYVVVNDVFYDLQNATGNPDFAAHAFGNFATNGTLEFSGGQIKTFKNGGADICGGKVWYSIYPIGGSPATWVSVGLGFQNNLGGGDQQWGTGANTTNLISGLSAGTYQLAVYVSASGNAPSQASCGCDPFHIQSNSGAYWVANFSVCNTPSLSASETDVTCANLGAIDLTVSGGSAPFTFAWTGGATGEDLTDLAAGDYTVTVTATGGCTVSATYTVGAIATPTFTATPANANCSNDNGSIAVMASGGSGMGYEYSKDGGTNYQMGSTFSGLAAGTYSVRVKDSNGCQSPASNVTVGTTVNLTFYQDSDGDTYGNPAVSQNICTAPMGYVSDNTDCNDATTAINPGATEVCNSIDDDCDMSTDEGLTQYTYYADADGDTYGNPGVSQTTCQNTPPTGYVTDNTDCNDATANVRPGLSDYCNGVDNDCDGNTDEDGANPNNSNSGIFESYVVINDVFYDLQNATANPDFPAHNFGSIPTTGTLEFSGGEIKTYKNGGANICGGKIWYSIYPSAGSPTTWVSVNLPFAENLSNPGDQRWATTTGTTNLANSLAVGSYKIAVYVSASGNAPGQTACACDPYHVQPGNGLYWVADFAVCQAFTYYADADGDTYGNASVSQSACSAPSGYVSDNTDCNDGNAAINPAATEICDAGDVDEDCDSNADDNDTGGATGKTNWYADGDTDTYGAGAATLACNQPVGQVANNTDCDDANAAIRPNATELAGDNVDQNCDGAEICYTDADDDGYRPGTGTSTVNSTDADCDDANEALASDPTGDCNDANDAINPGATEQAGDEIDQNCDGAETCFADADDDGYRPGTGTATVNSSDTDCDDANEAISSDPTGDCDDANDAIRPNATELAGDNVDQNCDGQETCYTDADDDGYRPDTGTATVNSTDTDCNDANEAISSDPTGDCDDANDAIRPNATELAGDEIDQNCDGAEICFADADNDGYRPGTGTATVNSTDTDCNDANEAVSSDPTGDCDDANDAIKPGATELAGDNVDQNCDGAEICYVDADDDSYRPGTGTATVASTDADCDDPFEALASDPTNDCNDANPNINPGATEICNGIDDNCNGVTDIDNVPPTAVCHANVAIAVSGTNSDYAAQLNDGSSDNCTPTENLMFTTSPASLGCAQIGQTITATLTVADLNGNTADCTSSVTIEDGAPTAVCKNTGVALNSSGMANLAATDVNNGSFDECGSIVSMDISPKMFDCNDAASAQTVTLTVTDNAGNSGTCQATVTVLDVLNYTETPGLRKASDGLANDNLGWGVGIDGPVAIAGAPNDKVGTQAKQGSAYVFLQNQPSTNNWGQLKQIKSTGGAAVDYFGNAVSIDGDVALIGGHGDNVGTTTDAGSAYIFEKDNGGTNNWGQAAQLSASDFEAYEYFGSSVALKNGIAAVGANKDKIDGKAAQGSVYIFAKSGSLWPQVKKITAHDGAANNFFGNAVSQSNGLLLVGANGNLSNRGAAYLYGQNTGGTNNWGLVKKLTAGDAAVGDGFGTSVSLSGDYALAGAPNKATYSGAAYVFQKDQGGAGNWGQVKKLAPTDLVTNDRFGTAVALSGDYAYVTALRGNADKGAVYVFHKNQGGSENWGQIGKYTAAAGATGDQFGYALGVSGNFMAVGANLDDVDGKADQGAVYFFTGADCPDLPKPTDETTGTTKLAENAAPQVRCQPNPFRDELTIEVSAQGAKHLQVTDAAGRLMVEADLPAGATRFDLNSSTFRGGLYFVQVSGENGVRVVPVALVR